MEKGELYLVTGATGKQGGAAARHLLNAGLRVRALTRNPESQRAKDLQSAGAEIVRGDLNDTASLEPVMEGVHGLFIVTNYWEKGTGTKEVQQSNNLVDVAGSKDVKHIVYASIARCDDNPGLKHFVSKHEGERYIEKSGIDYTFLRAVYFMDNLSPRDPHSKVHWAALSRFLSSRGSLQMISCHDIGWFATNAFLYPGEWKNRTLDIAGAELSYTAAQESYKHVMGRAPKKAALISRIVMLAMPEIKKMFNWYREPRFKADLTSLKMIHPGLQSFEDYLIALSQDK